MGLDEFNAQLSAWIASAKDYFSDLTNEEKYGWVAEGAGFAIFVTGLVLLVI